ncbi:MAG: glutaredoxin family protein [Gammaproteobacteria bacterium]|nr:glutaredoxin family protein [Gammaproteobacteria bacterium]
MKTNTILFIILCLLTLSQLSYSKIYKWVDQNGDIQFSDQKPQKGHETEQVEVKVNSVKNPHVSDYSLIPESYGKKNVSNKNSNKKVIMYSATWCGVCKQAKKYFNRQGIAYKEYDIEKTSKGRKDYKRLQGRGVPIILVGKKRMDGFDAQAFDKMYRG